jgi:hypothetical protein
VTAATAQGAKIKYWRLLGLPRSHPFHCGDERRRIEEGYGHTGLTLDAYRLRPERVEQDLAACGFTVLSRTVREPVGAEKTPQAYLLARALEP